MKRILSILAIVLAVGIAGGNFITLEAKGKKGSPSLVSKNANGYKSPLGHTYKLSDSDANVTMEFISEDKVVLNYNVGDKRNSMELTWTQNESDIEIPGLETIKISKGGRTLTENTGKIFKLVK